jgi:hypothetical protein
VISIEIVYRNSIGTADRAFRVVIAHAIQSGIMVRGCVLESGDTPTIPHADLDQWLRSLGSRNKPTVAAPCVAASLNCVAIGPSTVG